MREIKFRVWDNNSEIMHYENIKICENGNFEVYDEYDDCFYYNCGNKDSDLILMQYTGLKDKNGKEIYEGDIIQGEYAFIPGVIEKGKVFYNDNLTGYSIEASDSTGPALNCFVGIEVIGNIYEKSRVIGGLIMNKEQCLEILAKLIIAGETAEDKDEKLQRKIDALKYAKGKVMESEG